MRRLHSEQFKAEVLAACNEFGISVIEVARRYGVHVNLVHKWGGQAKRTGGKSRQGVEASKQNEFIAVPLKAVSLTEQLVVKVRRGRTEVEMYWPLSHAEQCMQSVLGVCDAEG